MLPVQKKVSFIGDLLIGVVIIVFIYLFIVRMQSNTLSQIIDINKKYNITENHLFPDDLDSYISDMSKANNQDVATPIIDIMKLRQDSERINETIRYAIATGNQCAPESLKTRINAFLAKQEIIKKQFEEKRSDKKLENIQWNSYLNILEETKDYQTAQIELETLPTCI